jgi:hypothetical protein
MIETNSYIPYTYLVGWSKHNVWYYGVEWKNNRHTKKFANPSNLWTTYFTSSKYVKQFREKYGEPDVVEVRKTFPGNPEMAILWEEKVHLKMNVAHDNRWLNRRNGNKDCVPDANSIAKASLKRSLSMKGRKQPLVSERQIGMVTCKNLVTGEVKRVPKEDYDNDSSLVGSCKGQKRPHCSESYTSANRKMLEEGIHPSQIILTCEVCGVTMSKPMFVRWKHGSKCERNVS